LKRGAEALDLIGALNTGHQGSMSTVHANSPEEALWRLETLALLDAAGLHARAVRRQLHSAIDVVVQMGREAARRKVVTIADIVDGEIVESYPT
jgi:pilus assembly protein CpaF